MHHVWQGSHAHNALAQALKKARRFEVRKTVRRLKECSSEGDVAQQGMARKLEQQLEAAKTLDIEALTRQV